MAKERQRNILEGQSMLAEPVEVPPDESQASAVVARANGQAEPPPSFSGMEVADPPKRPKRKLIVVGNVPAAMAECEQIIRELPPADREEVAAYLYRRFQVGTPMHQYQERQGD